MDKVRKDTPKKQHYVPQFLLKRFSFGNKNHIYVFDKKNKKSFKSSVRDCASENGFYNLNINGEKYTLEYKLSELESICSSTIKNICRNESLEHIHYGDRTILYAFVANLLTRVKKQRVALEQISALMDNFLTKENPAVNKIDDLKKIDDELIESQHIKFMAENMPEFIERLSDKKIAIFRAPKGSNFVISDNPVAIYNHWPQEYRGNQGISLPGIEIQLPISNKLCLSFICPHLYDELENLQRRVKAKSIININTLPGDVLISSVQNGCAVELETENVVFINSLQISDSLNYIYSSNDDFRLAEKILKDYPGLGNGIVVHSRF